MQIDSLINDVSSAMSEVALNKTDADSKATAKAEAVTADQLAQAALSESKDKLEAAYQALKAAL